MNAAPIRQEDVFELSPEGGRQLQSSSTQLGAADLELLVLLDGRSPVEAIGKRLRSVKAADLERLLGSLLERGLIAHSLPHESDSLDFTNFFNVKADPSAAAVEAAGSEAASGASSLQQMGYYVRIARSPRKKRVVTKDETLSVIVVEDEPHLAKLLKGYLQLEGFEARIAADRAGIIAELRRAPLPSLVLLDVMLPDADGFDILAAIRRHPALAGVPVIMLTAKSTREAVLKGLAGGADGYITKPFEMDVLMKALRVVLGLPEA